MSYGVGCRHSLGLTLLRLWCRLAAAALIRPLAREPPYAAGEAFKRQKKECPVILLPKIHPSPIPSHLDPLILLLFC